MGITDKILADMRRGVCWSEICRQYDGQSQKYKALEIFLPEAGRKHQQLVNSLNEGQKKLDKVNDELDKKQQQFREVSLGVDQLRNEKSVLVKETEELSEKLCWLKKSVVDFESRGYNENIVKRIEVIEKRSGNDLLDQIKTVDEYNSIVCEFAKLKKQKKTLEKYVDDVKEKKRRTESETKKVERKLDDLKVESLSFSDAVKISEGFIKEGYNVDLMKSLRHGLKVERGSDNPPVVLRRFLDKVRKVKSVYELEVQIKKKNDHLHRIHQQIDLATQKKEDVLDNLSSVADRIGDVVKDEVIQVSNMGKKGLQDQIEFSNKLLQNQNKKIGTMFEFFQKNLQSNIELNNENARLGENVNYGKAFWSFLNSNEWLLDLSPEVVGKVLEKVAFWSSKKMNSHIMVMQNDAVKSGLNPYFSYNPSALLRFLAKKICEMN